MLIRIQGDGDFPLFVLRRDRTVIPAVRPYIPIVMASAMTEPDDVPRISVRFAPGVVNIMLLVERPIHQGANARCQIGHDVVDAHVPISVRFQHHGARNVLCNHPNGAFSKGSPHGKSNEVDARVRTNATCGRGRSNIPARRARVPFRPSPSAGPSAQSGHLAPPKASRR